MAEGPEPSAPSTSAAAALQPTDNWQYQELSSKSADVAMALAANKLSGILASYLKARGIIGQPVFEQATNYALGVTEYTRVEHLVTAVLTKTKYNPQCYHDFIQILKLDCICPDTEAACTLLPKAAPATTTTTSSSGEEVMETEPPPTLEELVKKVRISLDLLDQKCSDEHLKSISLFLDWRSVAPHLGLSERDIEDIEFEKKKESERRLKTLQMWKMKYGYKATLKKLAEVLLKVENADDAERVCCLLQTPAGKLSATPTTPATAPKQPERLQFEGTEYQSPTVCLSPTVFQSPTVCQSPTVYQSSISIDDIPAMFQLLSFPVSRGRDVNILEQIGTRYKPFGILLLQDCTGAVVDSIAHKNHYVPLNINIDILQKWSSGGEGMKPVSWRILVDCLKKTGMIILAEDIEQALAE